jgi:release factor glutamine methyltransferase
MLAGKAIPQHQRSNGNWIHVISIAVLVVCGIVPWWHSPSPIHRIAETHARVIAWRTVDDLPKPLAQFESVFWEPRDTDSLRQEIRQADWLRGKSVLEIGTGTGLIAICCLRAGAAKVVATDVNRAAVTNANQNATQFGVDQRISVRLVPLKRAEAFSVIRADERFDLIVSNPPWENSTPRSIAEYALYDPGFRLLHSLLAEARRHLRPGGRIWLAYGSIEAIQQIQMLAPQYGWDFKSLDPRDLSELPPVFLPGMLIELRPANE